MKDITKYWETVQADVCANCIDSNGEGVCRLAGDVECGLKRYFSAVVDSVLSVQNDNLGPYEKALRENVCASCDHQSEDGACYVRTNVDCGLDRYFPMVVESIENFRSERKGNVTGYTGAQ
jgi:hypothetical protein